jgi:ABC-type cobalamin/Fe3+-siderophores transport system ATPase subunit
MKVLKIKYNNHDFLSDIELDFINQTTGKPYEIIILAGENGTGKSTILNDIVNVNSQLPNSNARQQVKVSCEKNNDHANRPILITNDKHLQNDTNSNYQNISLGDFNNINHSIKDILKGIYFQTINNTYTNVQNASEKDSITDIRNNSSKEIIIFQNWFNEFFIDSDLKMETNYSDKTGIRFRKKGQFFNIDKLSDGEKKILSIAGRIISCRDKLLSSVILFDEPEEKLHFK